MLRVCRSSLSYVARDLNGVPYTGVAARSLGELARQRGYTSSTWINVATAISTEHVPREGEMPAVVVVDGGAHLRVYNTDQLSSLRGQSQPDRSRNMNVNGRPFSDKMDERLSVFASGHGFTNPYWGTSEYLADVFGVVPLPDAIGYLRSYTSWDGVHHSDTFFNVQQTARPTLFTPAVCNVEFVSLPKRKQIVGRSARVLHGHIVQHGLHAPSPFWGSHGVLERFGGVLRSDAVGCALTFPTFRIVYNASQVVDVDAFHRQLKVSSQ